MSARAADNPASSPESSFFGAPLGTPRAVVDGISRRDLCMSAPLRRKRKLIAVPVVAAVATLGSAGAAYSTCWSTRDVKHDQQRVDGKNDWKVVDDWKSDWTTDGWGNDSWNNDWKSHGTKFDWRFVKSKSDDGHDDGHFKKDGDVKHDGDFKNKDREVKDGDFHKDGDFKNKDGDFKNKDG